MADEDVGVRRKLWEREDRRGSWTEWSPWPRLALGFLRLLGVLKLTRAR